MERIDAEFIAVGISFFDNAAPEADRANLADAAEQKLSVNSSTLVPWLGTQPVPAELVH